MSERVLEFGTAKAGPGEKGNGFIKVAEFCDGSPLNTPIIILNGMNPGRARQRVAKLHLFSSLIEPTPPIDRSI